MTRTGIISLLTGILAYYWTYQPSNWTPPRFVDRDMFMRYRGGAPGHVATSSATNYFLQDRDDVDLRYQTSHPMPGDGEEPLDTLTHLDLQDVNDQDGWKKSDHIAVERESDGSEIGSESVDEGDEGSDDASMHGFDDALGAEDGEDEDDEWAAYDVAAL